MKKHIKILIAAITFTMLNVVFISTSYADSPPPPPAHGQTGNQVPGGGAPIGGGALILALLGAGYGVAKLYSKNKTEKAG
jgi:hypothetical protein